MVGPQEEKDGAEEGSQEGCWSLERWCWLGRGAQSESLTSPQAALCPAGLCMELYVPPGTEALEVAAGVPGVLCVRMSNVLSQCAPDVAGTGRGEFQASPSMMGFFALHATPLTAGGFSAAGVSPLAGPLAGLVLPGVTWFAHRSKCVGAQTSCCLEAFDGEIPASHKMCGLKVTGWKLPPRTSCME